MKERSIAGSNGNLKNFIFRANLPFVKECVTLRNKIIARNPTWLILQLIFILVVRKSIYSPPIPPRLKIILNDKEKCCKVLQYFCVTQKFVHFYLNCKNNNTHFSCNKFLSESTQKLERKKAQLSLLGRVDWENFILSGIEREGTWEKSQYWWIKLFPGLPAHIWVWENLHLRRKYLVRVIISILSPIFDL